MKKTIVCFGDSNTHGYDSATDGRFDISERFPGLLQESLGQDYLICEEGLSGRTTVFEDPLFEGLSGISAIHSCLMTHEPVDLLIIMLGTNDTKERFHVNAIHIAKGLERLALKAMSTTNAFRNNQPNILLIAPVPIDEKYQLACFANEMGFGCAEKSKLLAYYYQQTADLIGCHFLDAGQIPGIQTHPTDYIHLDKQSHSLLAKTLATNLPSLLCHDDRRE